MIVAEKGASRIRPENPGGYTVPHQSKTVLDNRRSDNSAQVETISAAPEAPIDVPVQDAATQNNSAKKEKAAVPQRIQPLVDTDSLNAGEWGPRKSMHSKAQEADRVIIEGAPANGTKTAPVSTLNAPGIPKPLPPLNQSGIRDPYAPKAQGVAEKNKDSAKIKSQKAPARMTVTSATSKSASKKVPAPYKRANSVAKTQTKSVQAAKSVNVTQTASSSVMAPGSYRVQLASLKSEEQAGRAWQMAAKKHGSLKGVPHAVVKADLGSKGVYYRVQAGSFKNMSDAKALCQTLQGEKGSCYVVKG